MTLPVVSGSRVTRRMVLLFVACAMLPVAAALLVSYHSVNKLLVEQRVGLLREAANSYSVSLVERLNVAESAAWEFAGNYASAPGRQSFQRLNSYFLGVAALSDFRARVLFGRPTGPIPRAREKGSVPLAVSRAWTLAVVSASTRSPGVWLVERQKAAGANKPRLAFELKPNFLWSTDQLSYPTSVCVLTADRRPLDCNAPVSPAARAKLAAGVSGSNGNFHWTNGSEAFLSGYHQIFLLGRFGAQPWTVIASQPTSYVLAPVHTVGKLVLPLVVLALLVAAFLGLVQVRRTLSPLQELTDATARLGERDFSVRVPVARGNEFGVLAETFNTMSHRLGRQFNAMQAHSEINALTMTTMDLVRVAEIVLKRITELSAADRYWLLLADGSGDQLVPFRSNDVTPDATRSNVELSPGDRERLLNGSDNGVHVLDSLSERNVFALPILLGTELGGALVLAYNAPQRPAEDEVMLLRDLCDRIAAALATLRRDKELHHRANFDTLTGLPNRSLAMDILSRAIASAERYRNTLAVLFVDIDGFSDVNDSAGHPVGDQLLQQIATRLRNCVRKSETVARLGGDEFAIVLNQVIEPQDGAIVAQHVIDTISAPYHLGTRSSIISASVGIAIYPSDGVNAEDLLRHADLAMYRAKRSGRGRFAFFEASMSAEAHQRAALAGELHKALDEGQLLLHYQPQLDLRGRRIVGAEALLRWHHPSRGLVPPLQFIAFAESAGLIDQLGRWALHEACAQFITWQEQGLDLGYISVNVSPHQLRHPGFSHTVAEVLREHYVPATALHLELTESAILDSAGATAANLAELGRLGVPLELDDFGTGYSSLAYLQRLPVAAVKLDRAFIQTIESNRSTQAVVQAAINMVRALGKAVVAEGVETQGQMDLLAGMGCDVVQGFVVSAAAPADEFKAFVASWWAQRRVA